MNETSQQTTTDTKRDREELAVAWKRTDKHNNEYISVKLKLEDKELNFKAFANKRKKEGDAKPDYVAFKDSQKLEEK